MFPIRDLNPRNSYPIVVVSIIVLNAYLYFNYALLPEVDLQKFFLTWGLLPARFRLINLITYQFLHGGLLHLISNMWALWIFGDNIEDKMGHLKFLIFYLFSGIFAGLVQVLISSSPDIPCVGASGAIAGVMGVYTLLFPTAMVICIVPIFFYPLFVQVPALLLGIFWFFSQLFNGIISLTMVKVGGIAWWAHIGGFVGGILSLPLFLKNRPPTHITKHYDSDEPEF
ncbi:MAG: rhomboid family intramembrane serine protease [Candidatus Hydrogenedentes bacterium]|nr:rhomboid family intramembrane serine protease [Candidatus Hydrogenedentota bacterium]